MKSQPMVFAPFVFIYTLIFLGILVFLFLLIEINVISYAFQMLGMPPGLAFVMLLASLIGSYINIPVSEIECGQPHPLMLVSRFGVRYRVPAHLFTGRTKLAVNLGGAIVPLLISVYVLVKHPEALFPAVVGVAIVAFVAHRFARPVPGMGIALPMFVPPLVAAISGAALAAAMSLPHGAGPIAYVSGVLGTLIGADLANLGRVGELGAPVASIGGAGTFDGIFLTGIVAVLLA